MTRARRSTFVAAMVFLVASTLGLTVGATPARAEDFSPMWVPVDGVTDEGWLVTAEPIGGRVGDMLVAVAGPADLLGDVAITLVDPTP